VDRSEILQWARKLIERGAERVVVASAKAIAGQSEGEQGNGFLQRLGLSVWSAGSDDGARSLARSMATRAADPADALPDQNTARGIPAVDLRLSGGTYDWFQRQMGMSATRFAIYRDCDRMDTEMCELGQALDITASNVVASDEGNEVSFEVGSNDSQILSILQGVNERTRLPGNAWGDCRESKLYGDGFREIVIGSDRLIHRLTPLSCYSMFRMDDEHGDLSPDHAYEQRSAGGELVATWAPWEIMHLRNNLVPGRKYGTSQLFRARKVFKQLSFLEDSTVVMVLMRAPQRLVHTVLVPKDKAKADEILRDHIEANKRKNIWDSSRGKYGAEFNPLDEADYFVPQVWDLKEKMPQANIKTLDGQTNFDQVVRVLEFFQDLMLISTGVPQSYLGITRGIDARATVEQQEIEFARSIRRSQMYLAQAYRESVYDLQIRLLLGRQPKPEDYWIQFPRVSKVDEKVKAEIRKLDADAAAKLGETFGLPLDVILVNFFAWGEEEAAKVAFDAGVPTEESLEWGARKTKGVLGRLRQQVVADSDLRETLERLNEMAGYLRESEPVRV